MSNFVSLSWSPPPVSTDFTDYTGPVDFQYGVLLTNMNTSQMYNFTTNNTHLNISQLLLPDEHDICSTYNWSLSAIVEERTSLAQSTNDTITIPSGMCSNIIIILKSSKVFSVGPYIINESIHTSISECRELVVISIDLRVSYSC